MIVDKAIVVEQAYADTEFAFGDSLFNTIWIALQVEKGSLFFDLEFGSRLHLLRQSSKITDNTLVMAEEYVKEALNWLVDIERLKSFQPIASKNNENINRIDIQINAFKSNDEFVTYNVWYDLV